MNIFTTTNVTSGSTFISVRASLMASIRKAVSEMIDKWTPQWERARASVLIARSIEPVMPPAIDVFFRPGLRRKIPPKRFAFYQGAF